MANRIRDIRLLDLLDDPAEAEVWVSVIPENITPTAEVHGRLMGPRCHYASTVEVAYPLRPFARRPEGLPGLAMRVIIPEASLWEPETPFLYLGPVELWEEGNVCDQVQVRHGLRTLRLGPRGLRLNSRPLMVRGVAKEECSEEDARCFRDWGCNTLLATVAGTPGLWDAADRLGFLVLGRLDGSDEAIRQAKALGEHPCCLGWLFDGEILEQERGVKALASLKQDRPGDLLGVELHRLTPQPLPPAISFAVCAEELLPRLRGIELPRIVLMDEQPGEERIKELSAMPGILGWVES
jgi:hypothetical protein